MHSLPVEKSLPALSGLSAALPCRVPPLLLPGSTGVPHCCNQGPWRYLLQPQKMPPELRVNSSSCILYICWVCSVFKKPFPTSFFFFKPGEYLPLYGKSWGWEGRKLVPQGSQEIVGDLGTKELLAFPRSALKSPKLPQHGWGEASRQLPMSFDYL